MFFQTVEFNILSLKFGPKLEELVFITGKVQNEM